MTASDVRRKDLRDLAAGLVHQAGEALASRRPNDLARGTKSATELVDDRRRQAERLVVDGLAARRPEDAVLAEERSMRTGSSRVRWMLNPLEGTENYFRGLPWFGVSLAAEVDAVVIAAAVFSAVLGTVYDAVLGGGARADGELITCTEAIDLSLSLVGTGFSDSVEQRVRQGRVLARLLPDVGNLRRIGPATLDLCAVAAGQLDAFFETDLEPWECAAGLLIADEAGARTGTVTTPGGDVVVAAAPGVYEQLVTELRRL